MFRIARDGIVFDLRYRNAVDRDFDRSPRRSGRCTVEDLATSEPPCLRLAHRFCRATEMPQLGIRC